MKPSLLIAEIFLCAPFSKATLERLFSQMNIMKTTVRNRLSNDSLNSLLRIPISGITLQGFHKAYGKKCVYYWYNSKNSSAEPTKKKELPKTSK